MLVFRRPSYVPLSSRGTPARAPSGQTRAPAATGALNAFARRIGAIRCHQTVTRVLGSCRVHRTSSGEGQRHCPHPQHYPIGGPGIAAAQRSPPASRSTPRSVFRSSHTTVDGHRAHHSRRTVARAAPSETPQRRRTAPTLELAARRQTDAAPASVPHPHYWGCAPDPAGGAPGPARSPDERSRSS